MRRRVRVGIGWTWLPFLMFAIGCRDDGVATGGDGTPALRPGEVTWTVPFPGRGLASFDDSTAFFLGRDHSVLAVDKRSGRERWRSRTGAPGDATLGFGSVVAGPNVVVADVDLFAFDRRSGAPAWRVGIPGAVLAQSIPTAHADTVFGGASNGQFVAIESRSGSLIWKVQPILGDTNVAYDPVYARGRLYGCLSNARTGVLVALESATGRTVWAAPLRQQRPLQSSRCIGWAAVGGDLVVVTSFTDGYIHALERESGAERWTAPNLAATQAGGDMRFGVIVGGTLVVGSSTGTVVGLDLATGAERWRTDTQRGSADAPLVADDSLVFVTHAGGQLAALRAETGEIVWRACNPLDRVGFCNYTAAVDTDRLYYAGLEAAYAIRK